MKEKIDAVNRAFIQCFSEIGYKRERSVDISSGIDDSVTYIGSGISVLKPILLNGQIDSKGNFIKQKAIRTQSFKNINDPNTITEFTSFFDALCVLSNYEQLEDLVRDSFSFFQDYLHVKPEEIMLRINSEDEDLIRTTEGLDPRVKKEFDTRPTVYYKHKYGLDKQGIFGRNMNFAFLDKKSGEYLDVGNIIALESSDKKYGAELALGVQPAVMRMYGIPTSLQASYIADVVELDSPEKFKYAESLVVVANLNKERIMENTKKRYPIYQYKRYLKALKDWQEKLGISKVELMTQLESYVSMEYNPEFEFSVPTQTKPEEKIKTGEERDD